MAQADACYTFSSVSNSQLLSVPSGSSGVQLQTQTAQSPPSRRQLWTVRSDGAIVNVATGWLITVAGANQASTIAAVAQPELSPAQTHQRWGYVYEGSGRFAISSQLQGYMPNVSCQDGKSVILYPDTPGAANQEWQLTSYSAAQCAQSADTESGPAQLAK